MLLDLNTFFFLFLNKPGSGIMVQFCKISSFFFCFRLLWVRGLVPAPGGYTRGPFFMVLPKSYGSKARVVVLVQLVSCEPQTRKKAPGLLRGQIFLDKRYYTSTTSKGHYRLMALRIITGTHIITLAVDAVVSNIISNAFIYLQQHQVLLSWVWLSGFPHRMKA